MRMRLLIDSLVALMLCAVLGGVMMHNRESQSTQQQLQRVRDDVCRLTKEIALQATLGQVERNERGYPVTVSPMWFKGGLLPMNRLLDAGHAWVEIASSDQRELEDPPDRVAAARGSAGFWYNPAKGIVRARVPADVPDTAALSMYNFINDRKLTNLFAESREPSPAAAH
jgi:hypothetical protein